ncbi:MULTISPECIES: methyltransferase domain-containing protein [unclassified Acidovorax]|uniref:methyltransferase domain-containing protein n=1 Tax=unclassified Acidovorax TaxID=2684926 RepID=UPI0006FBE3A2|nr:MULTISPECIES: methyltransferase domain-containing protein [unclassified Acidovorax]KRB26971.1 glycosyl transferase family 2 [Acidovorax sp. Root70]PUA98817.1 methionine biosynthesis protein MetW [Acidovorax sp. 107]
MTNSIDDLHVYLRSIAEGERTSLSVLASLINRGASVLDLGCGSGALGQYLKETRDCTTDGVTLSQAEAVHAQPHYRQVEVADLETADLLRMFGTNQYDYIVCADVLEHLKRPESVLQVCRELLAADGRLLISVPNAAYSGLLAELLEGEFRYREEGLLDNTHLRFFTRRSLVRFLSEQRWDLDAVDTITRQLPDSEFQAAFDRLPPPVARYLLGIPDALTYQFIGIARPVAYVPSAVHAPTDLGTAQALFTAQLYMGRHGGYAEDDKLSATGAIGSEHQTVSFQIPAASAPVTRLRFDPADRAGFLHLYSITLRSDRGDALWQWSANTASRTLLASTPHSQIAWQAPMPPASGASLLLLTGTDPWLELPIPAEVLAAASPSGSRLDIELGWPMSADYLALSNTVKPLGDRIDQLESNARDAQSRIDQQQSQLQVVGGRASLLEESNKALAQQRAMWQQEATRLDKDYQALADHLKTIENSTVFRATRPLVHAKMRIDRLLGRSPATVQPAQPAPVPLAPPPHPVDVIVPVYRGLADTQLCINSALASQCETPWRLIVINDASPEPEVTDWLRERARQDSRITLLENAENLGFVGTVNRGMALNSSHDVLLLNSDTEVANDWLDRIRRAAYSDQKVGSVTPFSNNATICSYPRFCKDNALPTGYDTARLDALCAQTNPGAAVDVPTGVGFCMYIRRDCLQQVGLFDTENFGKGYGEENDFCQRAAESGWRNLHLLDTFVLHTGGVSFGDSKSPRERAAMETLRRLHPRYERDVMAFVQADPAQPYRLALDVARIQRAQLPTVLAVLHDRAGGTLRHVRELAQHLGAQAIFLTLTPAPDQCVRLELAGKEEGFELVFRLSDQFTDLIVVLKSLGVRHIHYHHLVGHDPLVLDLPAQLGVDYDFTAHDFYSYCAHISMTGSDNRFAGEPAPGQCACCAPQDPAPMGTGTVSDWRHRNRHFLTSARLVIAPSIDTARRMTGFAPGARVRAIPHTDMAAPGSPGAPEPHVKPLASDARLKVVVLGALSAIKGADVLEAAAIEASRAGAPVEFHLLGYGYRHLQTQPRARLTVHGAYQEEDLPGLLAWLQPDVVWFPALWPETYSYTLSSALQAGLPVAVPDIGAFAERVAGRPWSWVCPWDQDGKQWVHFFTTLRAEHFVAAVPPETPPAPPTSGTPTPWTYQNDYLQGVSATADAQPPMAAVSLAPYLAPKGASARSEALNALAYLRSLPLLRTAARRIPAHWQRRVKNWLQK